jgi:ectoine hydroxylase-related dioxygenase (phytanoyl-CoA dioxygenase family)
MTLSQQMNDLNLELKPDLHERLRKVEQDGYIHLKNIVSKQKLTKLNEQLSAAFEQARQSGELFAGGGNISGHLNCFPGEGSRFVIDDLRSHGVLDLIRSLAPAAVDRLRVNCNFNLPGSYAQHYHTDGYFTDNFYLCSIAVIDTDITNGAMDVLPGTHQRYYKFWEYALQRKYRLTTRVPMEQGDVLVRKSTMWHRGMPNLTNSPRPVLTFTFGEKSAPVGDPFLENGGKIAFYPNWYKTNRMGRLRERVFVTAPLTYSAYRFARSLIGQKGFAPD